MNETLTTILEIPLGLRVAIVMFAVWCLYAIIASLILKIVVCIPKLINWFWFLIYRIMNSVTHILHSKIGAALSGVDQTITDFCGGIYSFFDKIKSTIENAIKTNKFIGPVFLIFAVLTLWITLPTWLQVEDNTNMFTAPYHKYVSIENKMLEIVFNGNTK